MKNQETVEDSRLDSHKRKWYYSEQNNAYTNYVDETNAKKCITTNGSGGGGSANYDYENYQPNHQLSPSNAVGQSTSLTMVNEMCKNSHELNGMELSENIEYVNILYDENLLSGVQAAQATDPNYINFEPNWNNADILDLDQRNYYYETTVVPNVIDMAEQQHHQPHHQQQQQQQQHQGDQMCQLSQPVHHQEQYPETAMQSHSQPNMYIENRERQEIAASAIAPLPPQQDDSEDKSLSWLYNFKLNELPHLSPEVNRARTETGLQVDKIIQEATSSEIEENAPVPTIEPNVQDVAPKMPKKPPFTYTELIEYALEDKGELTVSGIYNWISDRFPFYKSNDDRWKNSVRHNLSINPHFRKGNKAPQGAGHLWIISTRDSEANILAWEHKKQRLELFFKMEKTIAQGMEANGDVSTTAITQDETSMAVANLTSMLDNSQSTSPTSTAAAHETVESVNQYHERSDHRNSEEELKRSAGEILNGVKRTVEVQVVNPPSTFNFQDSSILDYLNPVPKDQIVRESGLRSTKNPNDMANDYFVTELDPIELGINMSTNAESDEVLFGDEFNLNYFGIVPGNNIMA